MVTLSDVFPSKYLKATDLTDGPVIATIKLAELEKIKGFDGKEQPKVVVYFSKRLKPLPLNRTNFESIMDIADSGETDEWPGTKIELYTLPVTFNGKTADGIRIRAPEKPKNVAKPDDDGGKPDDDMNDQIPFAKAQ